MLKPDYRVSAILSPSSACSLSNAESIQVEIENLGTDTILVGQNIFVSYEVNSILQQTQSITMTSKFKPGDKVYHTFPRLTTWQIQEVTSLSLYLIFGRP